jgi:hypothetical protein
LKTYQVGLPGFMHQKIFGAILRAQDPVWTQRGKLGNMVDFQVRALIRASRFENKLSKRVSSLHSAYCTTEIPAWLRYIFYAPRTLCDNLHWTVDLTELTRIKNINPF